jgi:hypothetical protein
MNLATTRVTRVFLIVLTTLSVSGLLSCGGGGGGTGGISGHGASTPVLVMVADADAYPVIEFHATVSNLQLVSSGGTPQTVSSGATVELTHSTAAAQLLAIGSVPPDTYASAKVTLANLSVTFIDSTGAVQRATSAGPYNLTGTLSSTTLSSTPVVLTLNVNVASAVSIDASDTVTFSTPTLTASLAAVAATASQDLTSGKVLNLDGSVVSVSSNSFVFSREQMNASVTIATDSSTVFVDPAGATLGGLTSLAAGKVVEVNAVTQSAGTLLATRVEVEEDSTAGMETEGIVTSGTLPTTFSVVATDNAAPGAVMPALGTELAVATNSSTTYIFDSDVVNMTGLGFTFGSTKLALGQSVEVDTSTPSATSVTADRVKLQEQALSGTITNTSAVPSATQLTLSLPSDSYLTRLTGATTINVYQTASTTVDPSLAIATGLTIRARGLLFWDGATYQLVASAITPP